MTDRKKPGHGHAVHGARTHLYRAWEGAKRRCFNPRHQAFHRYGGRGIIMCERWRHSFEAFRDDMGPCPPNYTLDRIDNDGHYEPGNCRWATWHEQEQNRHNVMKITFNGQTHTIKEWARLKGLRYTTLHARLTTYEWPVENALNVLTIPGGPNWRHARWPSQKTT